MWYAIYNRRKFRSQTSDNMRRQRVRRKKMQMREKVRKSQNTVFFQWFGAPEGRKVGSLKQRVRTQLARWEMKNCKPLWREAHFQVKMLKTPGVRTTFGGSDVEKVHAVVARSTFRSQNVKNTRGSDHFWRFSSLHYNTLHYTTLHSTTLQLQLRLHNYTPLHSTKRNYTTLHYITLHYTTFHYTPLNYTTLRYTTLHWMTLHHR